MSRSVVSRVIGGVAGTALIAASAAAPAVATPSHAASPSQQSVSVTRSTQSMHVVGFDAARAKKAGNKITKEGRYTVLRNRAGAVVSRVPNSGARGFNTVYGNCGSSFFYLYDLAGASFALRTGFSVKRTAVSFGWDTRTIGQNSFQTDNWEWGDGGPLASSSWSSGYRRSSQDTYAGTYYYGRVTSGWALLWTGEVCASGQPNAGIYLYK